MDFGLYIVPFLNRHPQLISSSRPILVSIFPSASMLNLKIRAYSPD